jgi:hypothetical protein
MFCPDLIAAAMKSTQINVKAGSDALNEFFANKIEATGALINFLELNKSLKSV